MKRCKYLEILIPTKQNQRTEIEEKRLKQIRSYINEDRSTKH